MKAQTCTLVVLLIMFTGAGGLLLADPSGKAVVNSIMSPSETIQDDLRILENNSSESEFPANLSILATRLWEQRRFEDSQLVAQRAIQEWQIRLRNPEITGKQRGAINYEMAKLHRDVLKDKQKFKDYLLDALREDPKNTRYKFTENRQVKRPGSTD